MKKNFFRRTYIKDFYFIKNLIVNVHVYALTSIMKYIFIYVFYTSKYILYIFLPFIFYLFLDIAFSQYCVLKKMYVTVSFIILLK